jgi:1-acyl-sn-glycerol-3-phosphate acyltransferase
MPPDEAEFLPPDYSTRFVRFFGWWCRENMLRKRFYAVRIARENESLLRGLAGHRGPLICATNHLSWWDPLVMLVLHRTELCHGGHDRTLTAPMDIAQLRRFRFFRKLGTFGIDPDDPRSLEAMRAYLERHFADQAAPTLWINPQGRFADAREPIEVRPGTAKMAALDPRTAVVAVALEYVFWLDSKPELLIRFEPVEPAARTTTGWLRALRESMETNRIALSEAAISRDPARFVHRIGGEGANVHPMYGLWLRLRGKAGSIDDRRDRRLARQRLEDGTGAG